MIQALLSRVYRDDDQARPVPPNTSRPDDTPPQQGPGLPQPEGRTVNSGAVTHSTGEPFPQVGAEVEILAPPEDPGEIGRLGGYRVLGVLGRGGMGIVFRAEDPVLLRLVALKVLLPGRAADESARQRFLSEARAVAAVEHDHIVAIFHVGEDRGFLFLAMPLLRGEPLDQRLAREGRQPIVEVMRIGREVALGLAAAHRCGLVHRDIKPGNLWLEEETGRVKILDFGLARAAEGGAGRAHHAEVEGTPDYMAPEQARCEPVDAASDLFSLGCVLYHLATGVHPFRRTDTFSTIIAVLRKEPDPPHKVNPELPAKLGAVILQLLSKEREGRPASARAVAEALRALEAEHRPQVDRERPVKGLTPGAGGAGPARRWVWRLVGAGLAGSLAAVVVTGAVIPRARNGTLVVRVSEPDVQVFIDGEQKFTIDARKVGKVELAPGEHQLVIRRGAEELHTERFTLKSAGEMVVAERWAGSKDSGE